MFMFMISGCPPGYTGNACSMPCPPPSYGEGCEQSCGSCLPCHHVNGCLLYPGMCRLFLLLYGCIDLEDYEHYSEKF